MADFFGTGDGIILLFVLVFLILTILGFVIPRLHLLAEIAGIFLAIQLYTVTASLPLTILMSALSLFILLNGITMAFDIMD
jgi:uncharacterized membrane protein required for colicin V production